MLASGLPDHFTAYYMILWSTEESSEAKDKAMEELINKVSEAWLWTNVSLFKHVLDYEAKLDAFLDKAGGWIRVQEEHIWMMMFQIMGHIGVPLCANLDIVLHLLETLPFFPANLVYQSNSPIICGFTSPKLMPSPGWGFTAWIFHTLHLSTATGRPRTFWRRLSSAVQEVVQPLLWGQVHPPLPPQHPHRLAEMLKHSPGRCSLHFFLHSKLSIQVQTHQVPFSALLAVWLLLFWWEFGIRACIKRESFELIRLIRFISSGSGSGSSSGSCDGFPAGSKASIGEGSVHSRTASDGSVKVLSGDQASGGKDDILDSANEADVSQGSVSLLDISTTDDEDTHKCKACKLACKSDTDFMAWKDKLICEGVMGIQEWDRMVNDYADGGKRRLKNPDSLGPPISYMKECGVFQPLPSTMNPLGLCCFYPMDPASLSTLVPLKSPTMAEHLKGLLLLMKTQCWPYIIVVFQGGPITPFGLLQELHMWNALAHILIFRSDKTKEGHRPYMSCCPFCMYTIQNDPAYLNHIVGMHYHMSFMCGTCLSAVTESGQQMKRHLNECPGLTPLPKMPQESVRGEHSPKKSVHGGLSSKAKHEASRTKHSHKSRKSQPAGMTSQEDSQTRDRHWTCAAGTSQESTTESPRNTPGARWRQKRCTRRSLASNLMHPMCFLLGAQPSIAQYTFTDVQFLWINLYLIYQCWSLLVFLQQSHVHVMPRYVWLMFMYWEHLTIEQIYMGTNYVIQSQNKNLWCRVRDPTVRGPLPHLEWCYLLVAHMWFTGQLIG